MVGSQNRSPDALSSSPLLLTISLSMCAIQEFDLLDRDSSFAPNDATEDLSLICFGQQL
jgi:hypothetical protein